MNTVERPDVFQFGAVAEWCGQNGIAIVYVTNENVLVALSGGDREAAGQICGDFVAGTCDGREHEVRFGVGCIRGGREILVGGNWEWGGSEVHVLLVLVPHDSDDGFG